MIPEFKNLSEQEINLMLMTPALVTVLIAGAEGDIDKKEVDWGTKIAHFRANQPSLLQSYYQEVDKNFNSTLKEIIDAMPKDVTERSSKINLELSKLNHVFKKLDANYAKEFYKSMLSLSKQVAQASGGVWGYGSISPEEQRHLNLEAIHQPED
ncbi:MAG: hypothetical protein M3R36_08650 [Bacteroidota bacterium]|nr:hypothetical protein [Bacteroidota bacterium]